MKTLATIAIITATLLAPVAYAADANDTSFIFNHDNNTVLVIPKDNQSVAAACADGTRLGYANATVNVYQTIDGKFVSVKCK